METEAETLESISIMKLKEEKDLNCSQLDATINEASLSEFQKNEDQHFSPPDTVENSIQAEPEVATHKDTVHHFLEGKDSSFESEIFLESPSLANIAVEEICRTSDDCKDKEKPILVKNEQDKVMQLENDAVEAKHQIPGSTEIDALGRQNSTATSLNNARTEYKEVAEPSELPAEGNNVKDYMVEKHPSLPITSTLVDLSVQEGKLGGGEGEVMEESKQMIENLFNDEKNLMEKGQKDDCLVENSDEQMSKAICASQSIKKENAVSGSQKDDIEDKSSGGDPLIESGVGQTIGATPDHNHEASLVPALIKESLTNDDRSEEATKKAEVSTDKNMEAIACNGEESLIKNTESIPIEQELEKTNLHEEGIEGKEQDTSTNVLIMEKDPESIIQTEEIENQKKEGDENQQASLRDTCISTATTSPGIQNGEADNLEDEESTSNKLEIPSFTTTTEEANSQTAKPEESGIPEHASSFTLEAKKDAEKLKEEVCKRHEMANSNEYIDKKIIQEEEAINDQSAVSSGEEIIKCTQEDEEEEKHDVEVSESLEVAETSKDSEGRIMEAEDVEEHSTGKQEDVGEITMETDTNILRKEIHQETATEDDDTIQHDSKVSDGEGTVKDNSREDEKKAKDPVEVFEELETAGASEDTEKQIVEDGVFTNLSTESIGEQTIKESEVKETNSTDYTRRPSTSIATEASEDIHKERNEKLVAPSLLVSEDHIEGKSVEKAEITSDKLEIESVTLVTEKTSLHQAEQEDVKLIGPSSLPSEEMKTGTTEFQALDVEEEKLVEHSKLDENANESILNIKYDVIERACVAESESEHHGIERTTGMEITASETPKDEEEDKLCECFTSASTQPELEIVEAQENIKDETLMEEKIQGEKLETPMAVQEKEENFTLKEEICMFEETSKTEPEDIGKETAVEELQKQEPVEYKDAHKTDKETCIENLEQETAGELENTFSFETQEKSLDINKSDKETNDEYAREDEIQDKNKIDISEIAETRDEEVQEQSSGKGGSEVEAKEICVNMVSERVDTAASGSVAAKDTSDNVEGAVENLQGFMEEKEGAETSEIDSTRETGPKIEVEDLTNVEVLQQNIKQADSCEKIQSTEIEIPYKHHDESSASTDKPGEEIKGKNYQEEAHRVIEASKVSESEAATSKHEASGFIQTSEIECEKLEKTGDLNLKEEQNYIDAKEVTTNQEQILGKDLYISETEGVNTEERITNKDNVAEDIITVSLADEIAGQSCQEDETEQNQIAEPAPELKGQDLLHRTSDADDTTTNGTRDEEVYEGCKTGDSGESKEKQLKDEDCTVKNVSAVSTEEETVDESSRAESPREVIITVSLADEIAGQSCQEDETEHNQIAEPAPELKGQDLLHRTSDADDTTTNGTREEEVYEGCKTGDSGESKEKQLKDEDCTVKNVSAVSTEEETVDESSRAESPKEVIITVSLADEIAGQSCQEDETEQKQIAEPAPELKGQDLLHRTSDADDTTTNGTRDEEVYKRCKTGDSGECKEKQLKDEDCTVKNVSAVSTGEETVDESSRAESPKEVLEGLETANADEHIEKQILKEDGTAIDQHTVVVREETVKERSQKDGEVAEKREIECEASSIIHLSEGHQEGRPSEDTSEQMIVENDDANDNSTVYAGKEEHKAGINISDIPNGEETITENSQKEEDETNKQEGEVKESNLIPEEQSSEATDSAAKTRTVTLEDEEDTNKNSAAITVIEVSEEEQHIDNSEKLNETSSLLSEVSKKQVKEEILKQPEKTNNKLETSFITMETENMSLLESELDTTDLVNSTDLPSAEMSPSCPANVEASVTTLQAIDVEDIKLEETSTITVETENFSLHESELETTNLVDATDIAFEGMSPGYPVNVEASATTLQALDVEDMRLEEISFVTMETEKISLYESERETSNLVDATDIPSRGMSPGYPANVETSATTIQALDVEDLKLEETSPVDATNIFSGEMSPSCPASATTLQALDVEDIKLGETSPIAMETEKISLHGSELETTNVDSTDLPSKEMNPGCPANVEASATALQALNVEDMKLEETSPGTMETENISSYECELVNLVGTTDSPGEMSPGCPTNVEASATTLQALDVEDMKLEERSSFTKEPEKVSVHESEQEPTNLVDYTDLPSGEKSPGCPANLEASATSLHALDVEDMKIEETSSITRVSLHESELEPTNLVDSTDPPSGEMSPGCPGNVESSVTTLQALDVEAMKLEETSKINDNANEEILAAKKPDATEAVEGMKYNIMLEENSGTVPVDDEQGTEAEITAKICSDDKSEETSKESSRPRPRELDSIEAQEKITDQVPVDNETQDEKLEIHSVAQKEEEMPMQQEEEAREVEEDTEMGSEGREDEYVNELQDRESETKDKYLELRPKKHIMENFFVKPTQFSEYSKTEGSETESEKGKSEGEKNFDELAEEPESTGACAYVEKDILDKGRSESMKVKEEVVEDQSHERNEVYNATIKETIIENPKAVDPTKKLTDTSESDAGNQNHATLIETKKTETEEGNIISISVEDQIIGKNSQEEDKEHENLEEAERKLDHEDQSGKITYVNETSQGFILDAEVAYEDERPEESDKIQKQIMEEEVASQELYTASVNDEAVKEVKSADVVSIKQNFQVIDSSEKTETESAMDEKDWNKSNASPITTELGEELPKKEGSDMLETPSVIVATEERSSEEVEPDAEKNVVVSSIGFEEKSLQTVETTETSEKDDTVNLEERLESVSQLLTFEDENRNQENLTGENLDRDKVEEGIRDELVIAFVAAPQSEGPMEHANPESDTAAVSSLTVTAEEPEQKGQQSSQLGYGEQKLEIPATEMIKDNPMIEDVSQNMENTEIESTSDQNVEANKSEAWELGVSAAAEERKSESPIENETQDSKKVEVPSVPKTIEGKFPHKEEECRDLKASETDSAYIEKEMQHAEQMKEENLEITSEFIFNKNYSESTDVVSFLEKETEKTEELTETTEDSEKDTLKVDRATETRLREDEPQIHPYKKSVDGVFQELETVGASAYPGTDVLVNRDILENENPEEENSEAISSLVEKIRTLESQNTTKNEEDSHNINSVAEETLAGEADGECGDATNVELEKLTGDLESVTEAQIHDMLNETKTSQNSKDGVVVKDPDTVLVGDERIQEDKMADENVSKALPKFETAENHSEKTSEANKSLGNEIAIEEVNVEKKIEEEEVANQEVVFEGSAQKPDLKFVGEETVKDSHQAGQKGEKFGDGVNPSYPAAEGTGEHIKDEAPVEEILQKEAEQTLYEAIDQDVVCEDENTNIQIPRQGEPKVFLNDERETAERSITASLDELDKTSNMVLQEQSQVKTDFKSETQANGNETKESTKVEDAANLNENIREMSHIQPLRKGVLVKEGATELASVAEIEKSTNTTAEEQTPREVNSTESTEEENSTSSANNSPMPKDPIEKLFGKAKAEDQKAEQALEIDSEVKGVNSTESTKEEISSSCSTDISPGPMDPIEKTFGKAQVEDQKPEHSSEIESEVECGIEESTDEPKPSDLDKISLSDHLQKSIKETLETVGQSGDATESKVNKEAVENKVAPNIQGEEEKTAKHDQDEEEDEHKKSDSGSDAPVMVEVSRDVEAKPAHKKSHNILSGMGSKVKHSIAKVKKAITGKSSHHKQSSSSSSPKQESESTVTVKAAAADPNL